MSKFNMKLIGVLGLAALVLTATHFWLLDGLDGEVLARIVGEDTVYAPGYSEERFRALHHGMSKKQVVQAIGNPSKAGSNSDGTESWAYTKSANDSNYRIRVVQFKNDVVISMIHDFYVD